MTPPYWRILDRPALKLQIEWEPRDLWIGVYWRMGGPFLHVYVCVFPCVPIHFTLYRGPFRITLRGGILRMQRKR